MGWMKKVLFGSIIMFMSSIGLGEETYHPTAGLLYAQKENRSLTYSCNIQDDGLLFCEFGIAGLKKTWIQKRSASILSS